MGKEGIGKKVIILVVLILIILLAIFITTKNFKKAQETNTIKNEVFNETKDFRNMTEPDSSMEMETERRQ